MIPFKRQPQALRKRPSCTRRPGSYSRLEPCSAMEILPNSQKCSSIHLSPGGLCCKLEPQEGQCAAFRTAALRLLRSAALPDQAKQPPCEPERERTHVRANSRGPAHS